MKRRTPLCIILFLVGSGSSLSEPLKILDQECLAEVARQCLSERNPHPTGYEKCKTGEYVFVPPKGGAQCNRFSADELASCESVARVFNGVAPYKTCVREILIDRKIDTLTQYLREDWFKAAEAIFADAKRAGEGGDPLKSATK